MEIKKTISKNGIYKKFLLILSIMLSFIILSILGIWLLPAGSQVFIYQMVLGIAILTLLLISGLLITTIFAVVQLWQDKEIPSFLRKLLQLAMGVLYPFMIYIGKCLKFNKDTVRRVYTDLNNKLILSMEYKIRGEEILILTPHCIQKSFCPHKITNDINNCKRCGKCNVEGILELKEKYGVQFSIVTGGTLARKRISDMRPKAIIAIACERDLVSGLMDVKQIPVVAVINQRPEGPCVNTLVDLKEVEKAIQHFIKE
ncbi:protein of unknown function DUF116 [Alkaliphilus metalliredigens QYMF]|uniref:DUF116 domain-containing protein n=1 Tax=Alkaliphilus metalliredigens (strain QYMF) TaxID=293826 RepID=A6TRW6_ALKMQ|nr:DUF116 domain-containing protein [Alkaliphilus metalliredigens]ABR48934.1 protein of unknown function DUF116 [Alkaliphilus metalliredigens QYMF]